MCTPSRRDCTCLPVEVYVGVCVPLVLQSLIHNEVLGRLRLKVAHGISVCGWAARKRNQRRGRIQRGNVKLRVLLYISPPCRPCPVRECGLSYTGEGGRQTHGRQSKRITHHKLPVWADEFVPLEAAWDSPRRVVSDHSIGRDVSWFRSSMVVLHASSAVLFPMRQIEVAFR